MYLLDQMERGTPQRKTVYRISLTLVKRETLDDTGGESGSFRRKDSVLLDELKEGQDESEDLSWSRGFMRTFRTFSTGQLELGRLKVSRRLQKVRSSLVESRGPAPAQEDPCGPNPDTCSGTAVEKRKRFQKTRSVEDRSSEPPVRSLSQTNGTPSSPATSPLKPGFLRRSFSFRHRISGDLLRLRTLSKDHEQHSSGSLSPAAAETPARGFSQPPKEKSRTLEVGAVLNRTDSLTELSRSERARGAKNRTLDNSDLLDLSGGARSTDRKLTRFFSGIFFRRDRPSSLSVSPIPGRSLRRTRRTVVSQSSSESINGGSTEGNHSKSGP